MSEDGNKDAPPARPQFRAQCLLIVPFSITLRRRKLLHQPPERPEPRPDAGRRVVWIRGGRERRRRRVLVHGSFLPGGTKAGRACIHPQATRPSGKRFPNRPWIRIAHLVYRQEPSPREKALVGVPVSVSAQGVAGNAPHTASHPVQSPPVRLHHRQNRGAPRPVRKATCESRGATASTCLYNRLAWLSSPWARSTAARPG